MRSGAPVARPALREGLPRLRSRAPQLRPGCAVLASRPPKPRVWPRLGGRAHPSDRLGARGSPSSRRPRGASLATKWGHGRRCAWGLPRAEWLRGRRTAGRAQGAKREPRGSAQAPPRRARGTGSPAVGPGPERSCPRTLAREAGGSGREGSPGWGWGGARSRREQNVEISRRQTWEPRRRAQLAGDTGFPGEKAGRTEVRTFSLSPIPHPARGGASSTHVSGKERKCQIAPHPLVSDGQPGPVALKLGVKSPVFLLLPPTPFPPPCLIGQRFSSKAVAANEWAGDGDALRRWGESWPSKGHVRMYWRRRGEWGGQEAGAHSSVSPEPAEIGAHKG